jgi:hypothetical protein
MRKKLITRFIMTVAVIASLVLNAGSVFAGTTGVVRSSAVVSPYWQSDSGSYSYIGISHPSLSGMASSIGVKITANNLAGSTVNTASFTVSADATAKLFIVATNASSYTLNSTVVPTANFMVNTSNSVAGELVITAVASNPTVSSGTAGNSEGVRDVTMLSMWGAIVAASTSTGFAMEFIGDLADSRNPSSSSTVSAGVN